MRILLIGNLPDDRQESMLRFGRMMAEGMRGRGHEVTEASPCLKIARLLPSYRYAGLPKYLGYLDKYVLHPRRLKDMVRRQRPDVVHIVDHANAGYSRLGDYHRCLVTCHDLQQIRAARGEIPQQQVGKAGRVFQNWILRNMARAPLLACVSSSTESDLRRLTGLGADRCLVIPNALNHPYSPLNREEARKIVASLRTAKGGAMPSMDSGFILNVGGGQWYKNRPGMLRIHKLVSDKLPGRPPLLMVGKPLSNEDEQLVQELGLGSRFIHLENIDNRGLQALYSLASGLLFPSWEEGFGWPIAEAQACGCPVFTSNRMPMSEVGGQSAVLIDPADAESSALTILKEWPTLDKRASLGLKESRRWDPETMMGAYEAAYELLAERHPNR